MRLRIKNVNIMGIHGKIQFLRGESSQKTIYVGELHKNGGLHSWQI